MVDNQVVNKEELRTLEVALELHKCPLNATSELNFTPLCMACVSNNKFKVVSA